MSKAPLIARILLGLIYFVFGLNGFLQFIPVPPMPEAAGAILGALVATGYFFPVLKISEIVCGALLLSGVFVPLALVILAPITIQIVLFHAILAPGAMVLPIIMVLLHAYLGLVAHKTSFATLLTARLE